MTLVRSLVNYDMTLRTTLPWNNKGDVPLTLFYSNNYLDHKV